MKLTRLTLGLVFCYALYNPLFAEQPDTATGYEQTLLMRLDTLRLQLNQQSGEIQKEKTALALQFSDLQQQCAQLQQQKNELEKTLKNQMAQDGELREQKVLLDTVRHNLKEGRRQMEQALTPVQQSLYRQAIQEFDAHIDQCSMAELAQWSKFLLETQLQFNRKSQSPQTFKGLSLDPKGLKIEGRLVDLGPVALAEDVNHGDWVLLDPRHYGSLPHWTEQKQKKQADNMLTMPVDLFKGRALQAQEESPGLWQQLEAGGLLVWPILTLGVLGFLGMLWRGIALSTLHNVDQRERNPLIARLWLCAERHADLQREALIERLYDEIDNIAPEIERFLGTLSVFVSISPLLGLLGTVTGMIKTFQSMGTDASHGGSISGGIAEALITTACGLMVAIPLMLGHALLQRKAKGLLQYAESRIHAIADGALSKPTSPPHGLENSKPSQYSESSHP